MCVSGRITRSDAQVIINRSDLGDRKLVLHLLKAKVLERSRLWSDLINDYKARAFQDGKSFRQKVKLKVAQGLETLKTGLKIASIVARHLCGAIAPAIVLSS